MKLIIAKLERIYATLYNHIAVSEYHFVTTAAQPLLVYTNTWGEGEDGDQHVSCSSSMLWVCVVCCVDCH